MTFVSTRIDAVVIFRLKGVFGAGVDFSALEAALDRLGADEVRGVLVDMAEITTLDGIGVGELIRLRNRIDGTGRGFGLINLDARHQTLLDLARLTALLGVRRLRDDEVTGTALDGPAIGIGRPFSRFLPRSRHLGVSRRARLALV